LSDEVTLGEAHADIIAKGGR
jgi:transposase, IS5 family